MKDLPKLIISVGICELVGLVSTPFTIASIPTWYSTLDKPFFSPPNWVFGPVWIILYFLMGVSAYLIWQIGYKQVKTALLLFAIQLALNFAWSLIFFGLHSPLAAFVDIVALWLAILATVVKFYGLSRSAAYLLIPYLLWVSFASILNLSIVILNP